MPASSESFYNSKQKIFFTLYFIVCLLFFTTIQTHAQFNVKVNNSFHRYEIGDTITFLIPSSVTGIAEYSITRDKLLPEIAMDTITIDSNEVTKIKYAPSEPGNYFCNITFADTTISTAALYDIRGLQPIDSLPSDFESYWATIRDQLDLVPFDTNITLDTSYNSDYSTTYKIELGNIDEHIIYGYMTVPKKPGPFTGLVKFPPFGNSNAVKPDLFMCERLGAIVISISAHNSPVNIDLSQSEIYQPDIGLTDTVYYRWAMAGGMRVIDYLYSRPDFDGEHIGVFGNSQGAGLALLFSGIDDRVDVLAANNPIMSQHNGLPNDKPSGFPIYVRDHLNNPIQLDRILNATKYYDAIHSASYFDGPAIISVSLLDQVSPAEVTYTYINQLTGPVIHLHNLQGAHSNSPSEYWDEKFDFFRRYFPTNSSTWPWVASTTGYAANAGNDTTMNCLTADISGSIAFNNTTDPSDISVHWEVVSGPGNVVFDNQFTHTTTATFSESGEYQLRFVGEEISKLTSESVYQSIHDVVKLTICPNNDCNTPIITTPAHDITISCDNVSDSLSLWLSNHGGSISDNAADSFIWESNYTELPSGCNPTQAITFILSNSCGKKDSTTATYSVLDTIKPIILAQAKDTTVYCDGTEYITTLNAWLSQNAGAMATDNCDSISWSNDFYEMDTSCNASAYVTFTVADACGNFDAISASFHILDTLPPNFLTLASDTTIYCNGNDSISLDDWLAQNAGATATDNCSNITWSNDFSGINTGCLTTTLVTFTATDECGLSDSITATIMLIDTLPPTFLTLASDTTIYCNGNDSISLDDWLAQNAGAIATDNCSNITWSDDFSGINTGCLTTTLVTFTATDECGLKNQNSATIFYSDTIAPVIEAYPDTLVVECNDSGDYPSVIQWLDNNGGAIAADNCNPISWINNFSAIDCNDSIKIVDFIVTDECNNSTTTFGVIIVTNTTATILPKTNPNFSFISTKPNPFENDVTLSFNLVNPTKLKIVFYSEQGILIKETSQIYPIGTNEIILNKAELKNTRVAYFFIEGPSIFHIGKLLRAN